MKWWINWVDFVENQVPFWIKILNGSSICNLNWIELLNFNSDSIEFKMSLDSIESKWVAQVIENMFNTQTR